MKKQVLAPLLAAVLIFSVVPMLLPPQVAHADPWDISTAAFLQRFDTTNEDTAPQGIFFSGNGSKMYVASGFVEINEYNLSTAWDISTASFVQAEDLTAQLSALDGIFISSNGSKLYAVDGGSGNDVNEYTLSTAWDISTATFVQAFALSNEGPTPLYVFFKSDGLKMYVTDGSDDEVNEYDLSNAWDVSSASFNQALSVANEDIQPNGIFFKDDGEKMFIAGNNGNDINEYDLSSAWDISTASFNQIFSIATEGTSPEGLFFRDTGTKMYVVDSSGEVNEYDLPTAVTIPISISFRTGSDTLEAAGQSITVACTGGGGNHDGNSQVQNFVCNGGVTVTLTLPASNSTHRWIWGDGTTAAKTFSSCASGTCAQQNYTDVTQQFKMQLRISEEHEGVIFAPMPDVTFTNTITDVNGTEIQATYINDDSQDDFAVDSDLQWLSQGTVSWSGIQWRGITVTPAGSDTLSSYGTGKFDIESFSKHVGFEGERHFRIGVDGATAEVDNVSLDTSAASLTFNATATGTQIAKVEFLTNIYDDVREVRVNDVQVDSVTWSVAKSGSIGVLTVSDIDFSENTIKIFFTATTAGGSGGGGGGGGGIFTPPASPPAISGSLTIDIPNVTVRPGGDPVPFEIYVEWIGSGPVTITAVQFSQNAEWFTVNKQIPFSESISIQLGESVSPKIKTSIPVTVAVPSGIAGTSESIDIAVIATDGRTTHRVSDDLQLGYTGNSDLALLAAFLVGGGVIVAAVVRKVRRR